MSGCGACSCGAVAARLITSSLASAQRGNEVVPRLSLGARSVAASGGDPGESQRPTPPRVCEGCAALRLASPPPLAPWTGALPSPEKLFLTFEVKPSAPPPAHF